jgi:hypothetical protein
VVAGRGAALQLSEQVQRLLRLRAGLGGVDEHRQAGIGDELHRLEAEVQLADEWMVERA